MPASWQGIAWYQQIYIALFNEESEYTVREPYLHIIRSVHKAL